VVKLTSYNITLERINTGSKIHLIFFTQIRKVQKVKHGAGFIFFKTLNREKLLIIG
jgi:hypothetical protein